MAKFDEPKASIKAGFAQADYGSLPGMSDAVKQAVAVREKKAAPLRAELEALRSALHTPGVQYVPQSVAELVRGAPSRLIEEAERALSAVADLALERLALSDSGNTEADALNWLAGKDLGFRTIYWAVRFVVRTAGRALIQEELERFAIELEKHYILVPRNPDETQRIEEATRTGTQL